VPNPCRAVRRNYDEDVDDRAPRNDCGDGGMKDLHKVTFNAAGVLKGVLCGT
jgi:hypothetical protein